MSQNITTIPKGQKASEGSTSVVLSFEQMEEFKNSFSYITAFEEQLTATRSSQMNFKPTWGTSVLRYKKVLTGVGTSIEEVNGEFRLQSGSVATNLASLETNQRGQYHAGGMGQSGIGLRIPTLPTGTQYAKWGYSDFVNSGLYSGVDATGIYVAVLTGGVETKAYQSTWNIDKLDGTGISGLTLSLSDGTISQIDFTWYGYGAILFYYFVFNPNLQQMEKVPIAVIKVSEGVSIIDPNQPLKFEVGNGASSTTDFSLYIGGHQFSTIEGNIEPQKRLFSELLTNYTTATNTNWQPLIAFRKKATFNGRPNSINVGLEHFDITADGEAEVRMTINGNTSNLAWGTPTNMIATETAIETKVTGGTALTTSSEGLPVDYGFVAANNKSTNSFQDDISIALGSDIEVILWIRRLSAVGAVIVKHAHVTWKEEW